MFNISDAIYASKILNISFDKFTIYEFLDGMNVELEHGTINPKTNVTIDNVTATASNYTINISFIFFDKTF